MADWVVSLVARLASTTGLSQDTVENVIHLGSPDPLDLNDVTAACAIFRDFYIATATGATQDLGNYIGDSISRGANACSILSYASGDLSGQTPFGSPLDTLNFTMSAAAAGTPLPEEVAIVCSYNADLTNIPVSETNPTPPPATIRPQQRRRGRLYLGPIQATAGSELDGVLRPGSLVRTDLGLAFKQMAEDINALGDIYLGVWSRADEEVWQVVGGYVDDAWDSQRRRGVEATLRTSFAIS